MKDLRKFWSVEGYLSQKDDTGIPEGVRAPIILSRCYDQQVRKGWVELASRIGLETTGISFPLLQWDDAVTQVSSDSILVGVDHVAFRDEVITDWGLLEDRRRQLKAEQGLIAIVTLRSGSSAIVITGYDGFGVYNACLHLATYVENETAHETVWIVDPQSKSSHLGSNSGLKEDIGLESLFTEQGLFQKNDENLSVDVDFSINTHSWSNNETIAAGHLAARIALEATSVHFPVFRDMTESPSPLIVSIKEEPVEQSIRWDRRTLEIESSDPDQAVMWISKELFGTNDLPIERNWRQVAFLLGTKSSKHPMRRRLEKEYSLLQVLKDKRVLSPTTSVQIPESMAQPLFFWENVAKMAQVEASIDIIQQEPVISVEWEEPGELTRAFEIVKSQLVEVQSGDAVEVDIGVNLTLESRSKLEQMIEEFATERGAMVQTRVRSSWKPGYDWIIQDVIPQIQGLDIDRIDIHFQNFLRSETGWSLELPIRFLQDLYPIDETISRRLGMDKESIQFTMDDKLEHTYVLYARNPVGEVVGVYSFDVTAFGECEFLYNMPSAGKVSPPTGWVKVLVNDTILYNEIIETDLERFWGWYQQFFLSELSSWLEKQGKIQTPLFGKIDCHVKMDAEERVLDIQQETFSVLEALHEDVYFNTLDYFSEKGKHLGRDWDAPGQILPWMQSVQGISPKARIYVFDADTLSVIQVNGKEIPEVSLPTLHVSGVNWKRDGIHFELSSVDPSQDDRAELLGEVAEWLRNLTLSIRRSQPAKTSTIPMDQVIDVERMSSIYQYLSDFAGIKIDKMDLSYLGNPISIVEVTSPPRSEFVSRTKLQLWKPTLFINARHHANEVSSTNAVLKLIEDITRDRKKWLDRCNLVVSPMANPDGVAIHYEMYQTNSQWKLHAARYNAAGFEFARHRFRTDTPYGESRIYEKVWNRWAPDIVVDDHGVPSHEWIQPFSGYNSPPRFPVSYWLPNALIYTIARALDDTQYPQQGLIRETILNKLSTKMKELDRIRSGNEYWLSRYRKYGHQWLPETFPLELVDGLITYRWKAQPKPMSTNLGERFPHLVSLDLVTEVADETASGRYLEECTYAHYQLDQAIIEWLADQPQSICRERVQRDSATIIRLYRQRPLTLKEVR